MQDNTHILIAKDTFFVGALVYISLFFIILVVLPTHAQAVSNFQFDATSKTVKMGQSVEIPVKISTDKDLQVKGADLWLLFDKNALDVQNINPGDFFQDSYNQMIGEKLYIAGFFSDTTTVKSGDGIYATIYMTPKKIGSTQLKFDCRGNQVADTSKINVNPQNPQNVIDCASTSSFVLTINAISADGSSDGSTATTVTPTQSASSTSGGTSSGVTYTPGGSDDSAGGTGQPSTLLESGAIDGTIFYVLSGGFFVGVGSILKKMFAY